MNMYGGFYSLFRQLEICVDRVVYRTCTTRVKLALIGKETERFTIIAQVRRFSDAGVINN